MASGKPLALAASVAFAALALPAHGADAEQFPADQVKKGSGIYAQNCAPCHGPRMRSPEVPVDLRKFPPDAKERFLISVTKGKNQMPPWGGLLRPDEIEALWAYVMEGEK